jgi:hypothetical protein
MPIAKLNGVTWGNLSKVNGVAKASISKINGIAPMSSLAEFTINTTASPQDFTFYLDTPSSLVI